MNSIRRNSPKTLAHSTNPSASKTTDPWNAWFNTVSSSSEKNEHGKNEKTPQVFGFLLRMGDGILPQLRAQPNWFKPLKSGKLKTPRPIDISDRGVLVKLTSEQFADVAALNMFESYRGSKGMWYALDDDLLETLLQKYPCFMNKLESGTASLGRSRTLDWAWKTAEDGSQTLTASVLGLSDTSTLTTVSTVWYFDPQMQLLGRVDADKTMVETSLKAPALSPEQAESVRKRWKRVAGLKGLPEPAKLPAVEVRKVKPTPVLTFSSFPMSRGSSKEEIHGLRLSFDYEGPRLPYAPPSQRERRLYDGHLFDVVRNLGAEKAALKSLSKFGLRPMFSLPELRGVSLDKLEKGDFTLKPHRGQITSIDQLFALTKPLVDHGFLVETGDGFPFELLGEPDEWLVDVKEEGNAWFEVTLGIDVDGERIDLLPLLRQVLADPAFPLTPVKGEKKNATWMVEINASRRIRLSLTRLRQLLNPLLEWLQGPTEGPTLKLKRSQASVLEELNIPWRGGERLRDLIAKQKTVLTSVMEPPGFNATLREYQREGLAWLNVLSDAELGGILADDMGLGKTIQVLAHLLMEKQRGRLDKPALIVVPTSLVSNWRDEAHSFTPDLSVLVIHGPTRAGLHDDISKFDLVITTYPLLLRDHEKLKEHEYSLLVLDEAQAIKNARSEAAKIVRQITARRRLAMTGTPLENHLGELWAQFDAVEPGLLGGAKSFTRFYRTPIEKHADGERRERLSRRIAPFLLRRRKQDVLKDLPSKTLIEQTVEIEGPQRDLYETLRSSQHARVMEEVEKRGIANIGIIVLDALLKLRQVCCDPRLVKLSSAKKVAQSAKLEMLLSLVDSLVDEGRNVLIFSQFTEMLTLISDELTRRKHTFQVLTGQTPGTQRAALVRQFQSGKVPLFLISLKAGGVGLNLTAADTVIHYDPWWNPAVEAQATDRAHRIGQDKPVFVYRLICNGTVEEKIQAMQHKKAALAAAVLEGGEKSGKTLRFEQSDIDELFSPL